MTSTAGLRANRQNAKRSTGPRSNEGKKRVSRNALDHGLSLPIVLTPEVNARAEKLAHMIAGRDAVPERLTAARRVAEAEIDLIRVRGARTAILQAAIRPQYRHSLDDTLARVGLMKAQFLAQPDFSLLEAILEVVDPIPPSEISAPKRFAIRLDEAAVKLFRLERYERRAVSRRKRAILVFESLG